MQRRARQGIWGVVALLVAASCTEARPASPDATGPDAGGMLDGGADAMPDGSAEDGSTDAVPTDAGDAGAPDVVLPPPPIAAMAPARPVIAWLPGLDPASLATVSPGVGDPAPPVLTPCPSGWTEVHAAGEATTCEPWPGGGATTCTIAGEARFPGDPACARLGTACPAAGFAELPTDLAALPTKIYVDSSVAMAGDGTSTRPFLTIGEALAAVGGRTLPVVISLAPGMYSGNVVLPAGVTLWGACVAQTLLLPAATTGTSISVSTPGAPGSTAGLRNLHVSGGAYGLSVTRGATLVVSDVVVEGGVRPVWVDGGTLGGGRLVSRGARSTTSDVGRGGGIELRGGAIATLDHVVVEDVDRNGIAVRGAGTVAMLGDVAIRDARFFGLRVDTGGHVDVAHAVVERAANASIDVWDASGEGTRVGLVDAVLRDGQPAAGGDQGYGIQVHEGSVTADRVTIERAADMAIGVRSARGTLRLSNAVVRDTHRRADMAFGWGVWISGTATLTRVQVLRSFVRGITAGRDVTLEQVRIADTATGFGEEAGRTGWGILLDNGTLTATGVAIERSSEAGLRVDTGCTADLHGVAIRDTRGGTIAEIGAGLDVRGGTVTGSGLLVEGSRFAGLRVGDATRAGSVDLDDVVVRDTRADSTGAGGFGLLAANGAIVDLGSALVTGSGDDAVRATGASTRVTLTGFVATDSTASHGGAGGRGLLVRDATVTLAQARLERHVLSGIAVIGGDLDATDVVVASIAGGSGGYGLFAAEAGTAALLRVALQAVHDVGLLAVGTGTDVRGSDVTVSDTIARGADGMYGRGMEAQDDASIDLERVEVSSSFEAGVAAFDARRVSLRDLVVRGVATVRPEGPAIGLGVFGPSVVDLGPFLVADSAQCGLQIEGGTFTVADPGAVVDCNVGACVSSSFDPGDLGRVVFARVATTIDASGTAPRPVAARVATQP